MTGVLSAGRGRHVFPRRYVMVQGKSDPFMKWVRIGILALALIAVLALVIIKRNDIVPGWHTDGDAKYYVTFPLKRASGIETVSGSDYLFSEDGGHKLLYGWNKYDGYYYYSLPDGKIAKGETTVDGEQYYFDASTGKLYKSTTAILDGKLWYFNDRGFRTYGIVELDGQKFCFSETGNLKKGLQVIDGRTYYFDPENECMVYGLTTIGGATYYFGEDGAAVTGEVEINGTVYIFGGDGKRIG